MLVKLNNVLCSAAPGEGESGGSTGGESGTAASTQESGAEAGTGAEAESSAEGDSGGEITHGGESESESESGFGDFNLDEFLAFDPFGEGSQNTDTNSPEKQAEAPTNAKKAAEPDKAAAPTGQGSEGPLPEGAQPGATAKESPEMQLLQNQVQQLTQALNTMQQQAQAPAETPASEQTPEAKQKARHEAVAGKLPPYQFQIPDSVMTRLGSDDPAQIRAGLGEFAQGVAQVTHYNMAMQMEERFETLRAELLKESVQNFKQTTAAETQETEAKSAIFKDFYGAFPELNKPELQLFVQTQAKLLSQQYGVREWNKEFRDTLGLHVKKVLGIGQESGPLPDTAAKEGGKKPAARFNAGSGAGRQNSAPESLGQDIADTLLG